MFNIEGLSLTYSDDYPDRAPDLPGDQTEEATNFIAKALAWRAGQGAVTRQTGEAGLSLAVLERGSLYSRGRDRDGCKLIVLQLANHVKGEHSMEEVKQVLVYYFERLEREERGGQISWVFDCKNAGLKNIDLELINFIIACMEHYYPDFLNYIYIFEMPWLLGAAFRAVKAALPAAGVAKLKVRRARLLPLIC